MKQSATPTEGKDKDIHEMPFNAAQARAPAAFKRAAARKGADWRTCINIRFFQLLQGVYRRANHMICISAGSVS